MSQELEREAPYQEELNKYLEDKIDLILVTYNRWHFTIKTLNYLFKRTKTPYRLIVVDNGSNDETVTRLVQLYDEKRIDCLILLERNYGLEHARAIALTHIQSEYHVYFDNDLVCPQLEPDWLSQEIIMMKKYPEFGALAMRPQVLVGTSLKEGSEIAENNHVGATFLIMRTELMKEVGWRTNFTNRHADHYFGGKFAARGLKSGWITNMWCYHFFHENWGYDKDVKHYHRDIWPPSEYYDKLVDPYTLIPKNDGVDMFTWTEK